MTMVLAFLIGVIAGLRALMAPAAVSLAARGGWLNLAGTPLAFLGYAFTPWIFGAMALGELVTDQLPSPPSRLGPMQFGPPLVPRGLSGAAVGAGSGSLALGLVAGVLGAAAGTYGGHAVRARLAASFGRDLPAALIEDAVAIGGAFLICWALR